MSPVLGKFQINCCWRSALRTTPVYKRRRNDIRRKNEEKKKHILVHGWLSVKLDMLFHACLLALSHSGRHGRTYYSMYLLLYVLLWCCGCIAGGCGVATLLLLPLCTKKLKKRKINKYVVETTRTRKYKTSIESKEKLEGPESNRRRRCSRGNL